MTEPEIKASFSEDLLDQLNAVVVRQQQIDLLLRDVRELRAQASQGGPAGAAPGRPATSCRPTTDMQPEDR